MRVDFTRYAGIRSLNIDEAHKMVTISHRDGKSERSQEQQFEHFLSEHPNGKKYINDDEFQKRFLKAGCGIYIWPSFSEEMLSEKCTLEVLKGYRPTSQGTLARKFISQFKGVPQQDEVAFCFTEDYSAPSRTALYLARRAKRDIILQNLFPEDETINHLVVFDKSDVQTICLMHKNLYSYRGVGGYKAFGIGIISYAETLQHNGVPLSLRMSIPQELIHFQGDNQRRDVEAANIFAVRSVINELIRLSLIENEIELFYDFYDCILPCFARRYEATRQIIDNNGGAKSWKEPLENLRSELVENGVISVKWKNEKQLFTIVKKKYPDAIYQHRPSWLSPQSLDIFIPSISLAIEYQGAQHYEPVSFFGGEEALRKRRALDEKKRIKCRQNDVSLIEWSYHEPISIRLLEEKMKKAVG